MGDTSPVIVAGFGLSRLGSMLCSWRRARAARAVSPATQLFVDIDDAVHGARMGWGPEIDDLHRRLARVAASVEHSACRGVQRRDTVFRMTFETRQPIALQAALVRAVEVEAMAPFVEIHVGSAGDASAGRRVWP